MDVFNIARQGVTLEELVPSQNMNDAQMDGVKIDDYKNKVGEIFKIGNFIILPADIETVASTIQTTGKAVMVWFYFKYDEWTERPFIKYPELKSDEQGIGRHSLAAVDFTLFGGKKALIIEDSWGVNAGMGGQRIIDEDFFKARCLFAAYPISFAFDENQTLNLKPKYIFAKPF